MPSFSKKRGRGVDFSREKNNSAKQCAEKRGKLEGQGGEKRNLRPSDWTRCIIAEEEKRGWAQKKEKGEARFNEKKKDNTVTPEAGKGEKGGEGRSAWRKRRGNERNPLGSAIRTGHWGKKRKSRTFSHYGEKGGCPCPPRKSSPKEEEKKRKRKDASFFERKKESTGSTRKPKPELPETKRPLGEKKKKRKKYLVLWSGKAK